VAWDLASFVAGVAVGAALLWIGAMLAGVDRQADRDREEHWR
jgi:hypothetical protein